MCELNLIKILHEQKQQPKQLLNSEVNIMMADSSRE